MTVSEGGADVSELGTLLTENYDYDSEADLSAVFHYSNGMSVVCSVIDPMKYFDTYLAAKLAHNFSMPFGSKIILMDILFGVLCLALFVFLLMAAGRRKITAEEMNTGTFAFYGRRAADVSSDAGNTAGVGTAGYENTAGNGAEPTAADVDNPAAEQNTSSYTAAEQISNRRSARAARRQEKYAKRAEKRASRGYMIVPIWFDRIPADLLAVLAVLLGGAAAGGVVLGLDAGAVWNRPPSQAYPLACLTAAAAIAFLIICIAFSMSCAVRFKLGEWWKNTLIWRFCRWAAGIFSKLMHRLLGPAWITIKESASHIGVQWKLAAAFILIVLVNLVGGYHFHYQGSDFIAFLCVLFDIAAFLAVMAAGLMLLRLKKGGADLASGNMDAKVDTSRLAGDFRVHGENLNNISSGLAAAVEERMKSERLKTELITNVSHDIKTPLTSIVNYVDLLSRENLEGKAGEYTQVLVRQSAKLKKLTEDLVEASKASTGNISVNLQRIDICETVHQAVGEYAERIEAARLQTVLDLPDTPVTAEADGRLLWRVLDNLLNNACKYSMPGTRVYITVAESAGNAAGYGSSASGVSGGRNRTPRVAKYVGRTNGTAEASKYAAGSENLGGTAGAGNPGSAAGIAEATGRFGKIRSGKNGKFHISREGANINIRKNRAVQPEYADGAAGYRSAAGYGSTAGHGIGAAGPSGIADTNRMPAAAAFGTVTITVKNISKERLNVAPEELTERFVRGDSSRTTEGSGLGLNIARSLTELQGGRFSIDIDGDLFKAEIVLNR